jgi:uncharacterized protein (DUF1778 family)
VLLRLAYLAVANTFAALRLLPMSDRDKDAEILALRHQVTVLQRQLGPDKVRFAAEDRAFLAALLQPLPREVLRRLRLIVQPDTVLRRHRDLMKQRHANACKPKRPGRPPTVRSIRHLIPRTPPSNNGSASSPPTTAPSTNGSRPPAPTLRVPKTPSMGCDVQVLANGRRAADRRVRLIDRAASTALPCCVERVRPHTAAADGFVLRSDTMDGMAKTRISISLEPAQAERIKAAAAEGGQDVSAFMVSSSLAEAARRERIAASFADIDAAIAAAEAEADTLVWPPQEEMAPEEAERIRQEIMAARARATAVRSRRAAA